jgi:curved DNA-binding protein CbpA
MNKNYYIILRIPANSTQSDIKAAYRRLAKEFHPDHYGGNSAPFQALQEAYSVLGNPKSRSSYDETVQETSGKRHPQHVEPRRQYHQEPMRETVQETIEPLIPGQGQRALYRRSPELSFVLPAWRFQVLSLPALQWCRISIGRKDSMVELPRRHQGKSIGSVCAEPI